MKIASLNFLSIPVTISITQRAAWEANHGEAKLERAERLFYMAGYVEFLRDPANGYRAAVLALNEGTELAVKVS